MRPLCRLKTGTPHTVRHLDFCPIMVVIDGPVRKAGHAGATAIGTYCERGQLAIPLWCAVFGEVNELVSCSSICRLALPFSQETRAAAQISRQ